MVQGTLFGLDEVRTPDHRGFRGPVAANVAGITYRQLDYWARTHLVVPSVRSASGSGSKRLYSFQDVLLLKIVRKLLETGVSLPQVRAAIEHLQVHEELAGMTVFSDGASVYASTEQEDVVDLLRSGQGVFGIALDAIWSETDAELRSLPSEDTRSPVAVPAVTDELAMRRQAKLAS